MTEDRLVKCRYTDQMIKVSEAIRCGSTVPGVIVDPNDDAYWRANTPAAEAAEKASRIMFHESERNCNTCKHLERVKHPKCYTGTLQGKCNKPEGVNRWVGVFKFHPDDPMGMDCYVSRWAKDV